MMARTMLYKAAPQRGQALVEFVVAAVFFLVPLFLAIAAIGKFLDVQHSANMAARYAAWERTVWYDAAGSQFNTINEPNEKSADEISKEIGARMLGDRSTDATVIRNTDKSATTFVNGIDPMWRDPSGKRYLETYDQLVTTPSTVTPTKDIAGGVLGVLADIGVQGVIGFVPPVPDSSVAVAEVSFKNVGATSEVYQRLWAAAPAWVGLDFKATGAILSNTWSANARSGTHDMVKTTVPTAGALGAAVTAAQIGLAVWDPLAAINVDVGKIAVDELPDDRLK